MATNQDQSFYNEGMRELAEDGNAKLAVCLCLDISGSMRGEPIAELNEGVKSFYQTIANDDMAACTADIAVITFSSGAEIVQDFCGFEKQSVPSFYASGTTWMGTGVNMALDCIERRRQMYRDAGVDYYHPWLILMTDGEPYGESTDETERAISRINQMISDRKVEVFAIGVGDSVNKEILSRFTSSKRGPIKLRECNFNQFFEWLSKSVSRVSGSIPGENVALPPVDWATGWDSVNS